MLDNYWWSSGAEANGGGFQVGNSLRFRGAQFLTGPNVANAYQDDVTVSFWFKTVSGGPLAANNNIRGAFYSAAAGNNLYFQWDGTNNGVIQSASTTDISTAPAVLRDPSAWYHVVYRYNQTANTSNLWINGEQLVNNVVFDTDFATGNFRIGTFNTETGGQWTFKGYMADWYLIDGQALEPTAFGVENNQGVWVPRETDFTSAQYGANGFHLDFHDPDNVGEDVAPTGTGHTAANNFTATGFNTNPVGIFSNDLTTNTSFSGANPPSQAFDNNTNTFCLANGVGGTNTTITFAPATAIALTSLQVFSPGFTDQTITFGGQTTNLTPASTWVPINIGTATEISSTSTLVLTRSTAGETARLVAIRVNGAPANGLVDNPGADYDLMQDSPTQNYATFSPALPTASTAFSDGNLRVTSSDNTGPRSAPAPFGLRGRSYWEVRVVNNSSTQIGICRIDNFQPTTNNYSTSNGCIITPNGNLYNFGTLTAGGSFTYAAGDVIGFDYNPANNRLTFTRNGGNAFTVTLGETHLMVPLHAGDTTGQITVNFGQQPFLHRPAALTDDNNVQTQNLPAATIRNGRDHFRALTAAPTRTPGANDIGGDFSPYLTCSGAGFDNDRPAHEAFDGVVGTNAASGFSNETITWRPQPPFAFTNGFDVRSARTDNRARINGGAWVNLTQNSNTEVAAGNGTINTLEVQGQGMTASIAVMTSNDQRLVDAGPLAAGQAVFTNALWWVKDRRNTNQHQLVWSDSGTNCLRSPDIAGTVQPYAAPAGDSVAWCWNAGATRETNDAGSVETQVRANPAGGFSIVEFTGTGANGSCGHGLGRTPEFILITNQSGTSGIARYVWHKDLGSGEYLVLNTNSLVSSNAAMWGDEVWNNNIFSVGSSNRTNTLNDGKIAFVWASVPGYSAFGTFQGNSNPNGPVIVTGFKPAWVMFKSTASGTWSVFDSTRDPHNLTNKKLQPNATTQETTSTTNDCLDFLSNGFKLRCSTASMNSGTIIYAAFAENPTGSSNTSPATAR